METASTEVESRSVERCEDNCNSLLFSDLCDKFDQIDKLKGQIHNKLSVIFNPELRAIIQKQSIYPLVRLLLPLYDTERGRYGIKQATIAKTYIDALQLNRSSTDAQRLLHWKDQSKSHFLQSSAAMGGDFCAILEDVVQSRVPETKSTRTLKDVNELLDRLAEAYGEAGKVAFIRENVLNKFNPREQKWLMRIIFQDLKLGLKLESVLGVLSPWASQCFAESTNLRLICEGGRGQKMPKGLKPQIAFTPMLAKGFPNTAQLLEVERAMSGNPFVMDVKLDGERMLCHVDEEKGCRLITRNGNDYSNNYSALASELRNKVKDCYSYILDGEVCAWNPATSRFVAFGNNRGIGKEENINELDMGQSSASNARLVYVVFDIVYAKGIGVQQDIDHILKDYALKQEVFNKNISSHVPMDSGLSSNGGELTQIPLFARRTFLKQRLAVVENRVIHITHKLVFEAEVTIRQKALESYFNDMMELGEEGLVVKDWTSAYELGEKSRSKDAKWIKMKPEYSNNMEDLDLIILGGYYGEGRGVRADGVSHFLLGVKDDEHIEAETGDSRYLTVGKIGTGYSYIELKELRDRLEPHWKQWPTAGLPAPFSPWPKIKRDDIPHLW